MMGESTSLPLPAAPASAALAATATAATGAQRTAAGVGQEAAGIAAMDAPLLFDLLLGEQSEAAAIALPGALPATTRAAAGERQEEVPTADPLLAVLAQMPPIPAVTALPGAPTPPPVAAPQATPGSLAIDAAAQALAAGQAGLPAAPADRMAPATAISSFPFPAGVAGEVPTDAGLPAAPALRFPPSQQGLAPHTAAFEEPLAGVTPTLAEPASVPIEATAPTSIAPLNALPALAGTQAASAPAAAVAPQILSQPADPSNGYDDGFGGHVAWLAGQRIGQAEIRVMPEHLGVIDIRLQLDGHNVRAEFHSTQPEVRQALEASLPRLREMLGQQGLQLAHAGVGQGQDGQRPSGNGVPQPAHADGLPLQDEAGLPLPPDFRRARGLLDVYA